MNECILKNVELAFSKETGLKRFGYVKIKLIQTLCR